MNDKFFGNSLDLFKYDILFYLLKATEKLFYYVPMLTHPEIKNIDPKYLVYEIGVNNKTLTTLLKNAYIAESVFEVNGISTYLKENNVKYRMVTNDCFMNMDLLKIESKYFNDKDRVEYFKTVLLDFNKVKKDKILFIDPDVGLDKNISRRVRSMRGKYLLKEELKIFSKVLKERDCLCYFQHLGNNKYGVHQRVEDLKKEFGPYVLLIGYKRILCSIIFVFNEGSLYEQYKILLDKYIYQYKNLKTFNKLFLI